MVAPPLVAMLGAWFYTNWQVRTAEREINEFCVHLEPGLTVAQFTRAALARQFVVTTAESSSITATKTVYGLKREVFSCIAQHDQTKLLSSAVSHTRE